MCVYRYIYIFAHICLCANVYTCTFPEFHYAEISPRARKQLGFFFNCSVLLCNTGSKTDGERRRKRERERELGFSQGQTHFSSFPFLHTAMRMDLQSLFLSSTNIMSHKILAERSRKDQGE